MVSSDEPLCRECSDEMEGRREPLYAPYGCQLWVRMYGDAEPVILPDCCLGLWADNREGTGEGAWAKTMFCGDCTGCASGNWLPENCVGEKGWINAGSKDGRLANTLFSLS